MTYVRTANISVGFSCGENMWMEWGFKYQLHPCTQFYLRNAKYMGVRIS